jgi:hypothetical protein
LVVKNLDLVDWTIREAQLLNVGDDSMEPTNRDNTAELAPSAEKTQTADEKPVADASREVTPSPDADTKTDLRTVNEVASSTFAKTQFDEPLTALFKAIVEPGSDTSREDRNRAIALRWVLRDIKNNRLKWWPVEQHDLWLLVELGLVEMRNEKPGLTAAGASAI